MLWLCIWVTRTVEADVRQGQSKAKRNGGWRLARKSWGTRCWEGEGPSGSCQNQVGESQKKHRRSFPVSSVPYDHLLIVPKNRKGWALGCVCVYERKEGRQRNIYREKVSFPFEHKQGLISCCADGLQHPDHHFTRMYPSSRGNRVNSLRSLEHGL